MFHIFFSNLAPPFHLEKHPKSYSKMNRQPIITRHGEVSAIARLMGDSPRTATPKSLTLSMIDRTGNVIHQVSRTK